MFENEIIKFKSLNQLAESEGIVIFGGSKDTGIPLGELKQAFSLKDNIYNRSFKGLTVANAAKVYDECIAELCPDTVILHIGESDIPCFENNEEAFEKNYRALIDEIKSKNKRCRIVVVSLKNHDNNIVVTKMNTVLKHVADCAKCEFEDISAKYTENVNENREIISFIYEVGFDRPLSIRRPIHNLIRILFFY